MNMSKQTVPTGVKQSLKACNSVSSPDGFSKTVNADPNVSYSGNSQIAITHRSNSAE